MTTLLNPANTNFLLDAGLNHLHNETLEWLSEIEFSDSELSFLSKLLDSAYLRESKSTEQVELNAIGKRIDNFKNHMLKRIHNELIVHERNLCSLDENILSVNEQYIHDEHREQKEKVVQFMETLRIIKKDLFVIVEKQMRNV